MYLILVILMTRSFLNEVYLIIISYVVLASFFGIEVGGYVGNSDGKLISDKYNEEQAKLMNIYMNQIYPQNVPSWTHCTIGQGGP